MVIYQSVYVYAIDRFISHCLILSITPSQAFQTGSAPHHPIYSWYEYASPA